jgi:hypothetical protein
LDSSCHDGVSADIFLAFTYPARVRAYAAREENRMRASRRGLLFGFS